MQQVILRPGPAIPPKGTGNTQKLIIIILTLFAFSGLLGGFTIGAFTRTSNQPAQVSQHTNSVTLSQAPTPSPTPSVSVATVGVGYPAVTVPIPTEIADNTTSYKVTAQIVDKSPSGGKPLLVPEMVCKIWLTKGQKAPSGDDLQPANLANLFPGEIQNALIFEGGPTQQIQSCSQGTVVWTYKLDSTLKAGNYYLGVLADWRGKFYNWYWSAISVKGQNDSSNSGN